MKHHTDLKSKLLRDFHGNEVIINNDITSLPTVSNDCKQYFNSMLEDNQFIRIAIEGGGCSGFQYAFYINNSEEYFDDDVMISEDPYVIIDSQSLEFMKGATINYEVTEISERVFVDNPGATQSCSCGSSFDYYKLGE